MILNWILALLSAILLVLLFPGHSLTLLAPVALTPLLIACAREPLARWRFAFGYTAGLVYWFGLCNWVESTLEHHGGVSSGVAWLLFALVCFLKALQMGVFAALAGIVIDKRWGTPAVAALWVAIEWTHAWTGFEWLNLGNAGGDMLLPLRLAPITGVWGLSFLFALMSAAVASLFFKRRQTLASAWLLLLPALFLLPPVPEAMPDRTRASAGAVVVQPNLDDDTIWSSELLRAQEEQMKLLSLAATPSDPGSSVDVIVWPEVPAPFYDYDPEFTHLAASTAQAAHAALLTGVVARAPDQSPLNGALLIDANGTPGARYDKVNLVPFGEFVPWPFALLTKKISTEAGDFSPGHNVVVANLGAHRIGTFICYESVFPSYVRRFAAQGAEVLFNISNDSWFGKSAARYQHIEIVRMRAAENRRWIVRGTNNGISAAIDPAGRVVRALPEFQIASGRLPYGYRADLTFYTRFGDWFVLLCALGAAAALMSAVLPEHHRL